MITGSIKNQVQTKLYDTTASAWTRKHMRLRIITFILSIFLLSSIYLMYTWHRYKDESSSQAIALAKTIEAVMPKWHISKLYGSSEDFNYLEYKMIKNSFSQIVEAANPIHKAYLMAERAGNIVILMNSESPDSPYYSPPEQVNEYSADVFRELFNTGEAVITKSKSDHRATWISALVPVIDTTNNSIVAVFRVDYAASEWYAQIWKRIIPDVIIVLFFILLSFTLLYGWIQYTNNKDLSNRLSISETFYRNVFDKAPIGIATVDDNGFIPQSDFGVININPRFENILGRTREDLANTSWINITHSDDLQEDLDKFEQFKNGEIDGRNVI